MVRPQSVPQAQTPARGPNLFLQLEYDETVPFTPENDALTALQAWVEQAQAPENFVVRVGWEEAGVETHRARVLGAAQFDLPGER